MSGIMEMYSKFDILKILTREMPYLHAEYGVESIALFGSFSRGNPGAESDIDLLVSLTKPLGFSFIQLADYLEDKLGRKVDLVTATTLERGATDPRRAHIARQIQESLVYV